MAGDCRFVLAIVPVIPGFLRAATTPGGQIQNPNFFDMIYIYAWFVTFAIGFGVYLILMKLETQKEDLMSPKHNSWEKAMTNENTIYR